MPQKSSDQEFNPDIGAKFDAGKLRYDLIPPEAIADYALILTYGAEKYSDRNWEKGIDPDRIFAALQRHCWAWMGGEVLDPENGIHHMASVMFGAGALLTYYHRAEAQDEPVPDRRKFDFGINTRKEVINGSPGQGFVPRRTDDPGYKEQKDD